MKRAATGTVSLTPGTYWLHVSREGGGNCGDMTLTVNCAAACLPPDSVTIKWTPANVAEIRFTSDGGDYEFYSTDFPKNDGDPRGGDPQWVLRATQNYPAGPSLWTDAAPTSAYRNYTIVRVCP